MNGYQVGEVVDITIKGARIIEVSGQSIVYTYPGLHTLARGAVAPDAEAVAVERVAPAEWPPRPGDLWRDQRGCVWFAADLHDVYDTDEPQVFMLASHEDHQVVPDRCNENFGPLKIVHREQDADTERHGGHPGVRLEHPAPGSAIPGQDGYVVGTCGHRVADSDWRNGYRTCERCPDELNGGRSDG